LRPSWLDLLQRSASSEVMQTPMWLLPWWQTFGPLDSRRLRIGLFQEGERLVGLVPLLARRHWYRPGLPFRRLEFLGSGERPGEQVWSDYLNLIVERGREAHVVDCFVTALRNGAFGSWDELVLPAMDGQGILQELLTRAFRERRIPSQCLPEKPAPYVSLPDSWEAYLQLLTNSHRYFIKRSLRDFEKWAGGDSQVVVATTSRELEEGRRHLIALHGERWQAAGEAGVFQSPRFNAFHEAAQRELLDAGALDLSWLRVRGEVIAALYNLRWNGKISVYQSGRRTDLPTNVRAGVVLHAYAIQRAIADGVREYDFLAGVSRYKQQFAPAVRPLVTLRVAPWSLPEGTRRLVETGLSGAGVIRAAARRALGWFRKPAALPGGQEN
jgi:CelD/BcsL family acetyltransferase involved in cellulose biosynthesis